MDFLKSTIKTLEKAGIEAGASAPPRYWYSTGNYVMNKIMAGSFLRGIPQGRITCFTGPSGSGKAQPLTSKVLTPDGWKQMGDVSIGEKIITPSGAVSEVTHIHPQGKKDIYTITFHDGSTTQCCLDHLWECWMYDSNKKTHTKQVVDTKCLIEYHTTTWVMNHNHPIYVDVVPPIEHKEVKLAIDPYLVGALIDIDLNDGTNHQSPLPLDVSEYTDMCDIDNYTNKLRILSMLGHNNHESHILQPYQDGSIAQRMELIRGLMDSNGIIDDKGNVSYATMSHRLATDIQQILWSLGIQCAIVAKHCNVDDITKTDLLPSQFILTINSKEPKELFSLSSKIARCTTSLHEDTNQYRRSIKDIRFTSTELAQCITIDHPDHLYITDDYIITHNSFLACNAMREAQKAGAYVFVLDSENALDDEFVSKLGVDINNRYNYFPVDTIPQVKKVVSEILMGYKDEYGDDPNAPQMLFIIDSLDMLLTETEDAQFDKGITKGDQGQRNKQLKAMLRSFVQKIKRPNISMIVTDGVYRNQDIMNGEGVWMVKDAVKFALSQIGMLTKLKLKNDKEDARKVTGIRMKVEGYKTRFTQPFQTITLEVPYETGMDPYNGLIDVAVNMGLVTKKGSRFSIKGSDDTFYRKDFGQYAPDILIEAEKLSYQFLEAVLDDDDVVCTEEGETSKNRRLAKKTQSHTNNDEENKQPTQE